MSALRAASDWITCGAFAAVLAVPFFARGLDGDADRSTLPELRNPAPPPREPRDLEALLAFPTGFDAWLGDRYAFRGALIRWHNLVKLFGFGTAPTDRIVMGPERWVYTTANRALEAHVGSFRMSDEELDLWAAAVAERSAWLAERGARYVVAIAPGKPGLYPEQLPPGLRHRSATGPVDTPLDQLHARLADTGALVVDLRAPLRAARTEPGLEEREGDWLYHRLGTHWTDRGAYVGFRALFEALAATDPAIPAMGAAGPPPPEAFRRRPTDDPGDSWAGRLRMVEELPQRAVAFEPRGGWRAQALLDSGGDRVWTRTDAAAEALPRVVLFHDSFGDGLRRFLAEGCSRLAARATVDFEPDLIEEERPDFVIQMMAERRLATYRPPVAQLGGDEPLARRFDAAGPARFDLGKRDDAARLEPWRRARLVPAERSDDPPLTLRVRTPGDGLLIPDPELAAGERALLRIDIECPAEGELMVLYQTPDSPRFEPMRRVARSLPAGRSRIHLDLGSAAASGPLLLLPGRAKGSYALRALEIRAQE